MKPRTSLVTALAVIGSVLAGTAAIAANIGVLSAAEDNSIGNLSAEATVATGQRDIVTVEDMVGSSQDFAAGSAGAVTIDEDASGLRVRGVNTNPGWQWSTQQISPTELVVVFSSSETLYEFHASVDENGAIAARVDQPIANVANSVVSASSLPADDDHDDDDDQHDDDGYEHEEHEREGGDDDD